MHWFSILTGCVWCLHKTLRRVIGLGMYSSILTDCLGTQGQKAFSKQLWRMAIAHFSVSLSLGHPDPPSVHCWRAVSFDGAKRFQLAFSDHDAAITGVGAGVGALPPAPLWATRYFNRGLCRRKLEDIDAAAEDLSTALQIDPTHAPAKQELGRVQRLQQQAAKETLARVSSLQEIVAAAAKAKQVAAEKAEA